MNKKTLTFLLSFLLCISCSINQIKKENQIENPFLNPEYINIPKHKDKPYSLFYNTTPFYQYNLKQQELTLLYGIGGRYVAILKNNKLLNLPYENSELTLFINDETDPEIITFAYNGDGVFSGFGKERKGSINFDISFYLPETKHNSIIDINLINQMAIIKDIINE